VSLSRTIERIQVKIKREQSRLKGDHPFNPLQKSVDSPCQQRGCLLTLMPNSFWPSPSKKLVVGCSWLIGE
jgi:hypothetical protein